MSTAPKPESWALSCYTLMGKTTSRDNFDSVLAVMEKYFCNVCPTDSAVKMDWLCATHSELLELHPGYLDFQTTQDMIILHAFHVIRNMKFVTGFTLPNGTVITNFIVTDNGILADNDLKKPGTKLFFVTGYAKHSDLYKLVNAGEWSEHYTWNVNYAGIRAKLFGFSLLLNPDQDRDLLRGKMALDFAPGILSDWCTAFLDCWQHFVTKNPCTKVTALYRTDTAVFYGSPSDHLDSYRLYGYAGLPLLLVNYHERLTYLVKRIIGVSKMTLKDKKTNVPSGFN